MICVIGRRNAFSDTRHEVSNDGINGNTFTRYQNASLPSGTKAGLNAMCFQSTSDGQSRVLLAKGAICSHREYTTPRALDTSADRPVSVSVSHVNQPDLALPCSLNQLRVSLQPSMHATDHIQSCTQCINQSRNPIIRDLTAWRSYTDNDRSSTACCRLIRSHLRQVKTYCCRWQCALTNDVVWAPVAQAKASFGIREQ